MQEIAALDATAQAELVRTGEVSAEELTEGAISRAEQVNGEINAIIHPLYEEGMATARGALPDGPFSGVPFLFKDIGAALAGQPLHLGTKLLKDAGFRVPLDSFLGARFRDAGLVTFGKTNVPELGILPTTEPDAYGPTKNPWDTRLSPGGSSGGPAAAVAAGIVPIAHANDGGGSIRVPASCCGLVGLKPTRQRISEGPLIGDIMSGRTVELIVSRSVRDTATMLEVVHGPAPGDPYVAPPPERPYTEELTASPEKLRIGIETTPWAEIEIDPRMAGFARAAGDMLEGLGHNVEEAGPEMPPVDGIPNLVDTFTIRWAAGQAATLAQLARLVGRPLEAGDFEPLTWALAELGSEVSGGDYLSAISFHQGIGRLLAAWFESGYDLLLTPTMGELPQPLGTFDDSVGDPIEVMLRAGRSAGFAAPLNATGNPAISLPLLESEEGLPVGIQLVAPFGREDVLIRIAAQLEQAHPWADRRAGVWAQGD